eukprot:2195935-Ditylum_brightwellii.AAC.1
MPLCAAVSDPIEAHVDCARLVLVHVNNPTCCRVIRHDRGGRLGCPILVRVSLSSLPFLVLEKRAPISTSVADTIICCMILHTLRGTLADGGLLGSADGSLRKKCPPAWLRACGSDMNKASECMWRTMSLAW